MQNTQIMTKYENETFIQLLKKLKFPPLKRQKICCPDVTEGDGLFLNGQISQHDRVDNHSRDMEKLLFFIK